VQRARSETVAVDRVFRQDPAPGERVEEGATVTILVSEGPGDATIPAVAGQTLREARERLEAAGFESDVRREISDTVPKGRVIETTPPERSRLQKGRTVELVVSSGPEQVRVPDVVGRSRDEAESTLEAAGFEVTIAEQETEEQEPGTVLDQSPDADAEVDEGSAVKLTVAKAPPTIAVPDVEGQDADEAATALREAGFAVRRRPEVVDTPDDAGRVLSQDPAGGEERTRGATVTLTIGDFEATEEPTATPTPEPGEEPDTGGAEPGDESDAP
jgi:serine/threonine-protein kinase